jgi:hypothetical protein
MADEPTRNAGMELFDKLLKAHRASDREAFSLASVAAYVQNQGRKIHVDQRMDAQVDAYLKAKYNECGQPDVYQPPATDDDMAGSTLINCTFNSDEAVQQITSAIGELGKTEGQEPAQPEPAPQPEKPKQRPWWGRLLGTLAAVGLGAAITFGAAKYFQGEPSKFDMTALPYQPGYDPYAQDEAE